MLEPKFKVGDEVMVVKDSILNGGSNGSSNLFHIGDIGVVRKIIKTEYDIRLFIDFTKKQDSKWQGIAQHGGQGWYALQEQVVLLNKTTKTLFGVTLE